MQYFQLECVNFFLFNVFVFAFIRYRPWLLLLILVIIWRLRSSSLKFVFSLLLFAPLSFLIFSWMTLLIKALDFFLLSLWSILSLLSLVLDSDFLKLHNFFFCLFFVFHHIQVIFLIQFFYYIFCFIISLHSHKILDLTLVVSHALIDSDNQILISNYFDFSRFFFYFINFISSMCIHQFMSTLSKTEVVDFFGLVFTFLRSLFTSFTLHNFSDWTTCFLYLSTPYPRTFKFCEVINLSPQLPRNRCSWISFVYYIFLRYALCFILFFIFLCFSKQPSSWTSVLFSFFVLCSSQILVVFFFDFFIANTPLNTFWSGV